MPAVGKKLTSIFISSPSNSPRLNPTRSEIPVPSISNKNSQTPKQVCRSGMPCSSQLFDMFKIMASGNTDSTLTGEVDSDEEEANSSGVSNSSTAVEEQQEQREVMQQWMDQSLKDSEKERDTLSARFTGEPKQTDDKADKAAMSLSNLIPSIPRPHKARPVLPKVRSVIEPSPELDDDSSVESQNTTSAALGVGDISDEEKLAAIKDEFGDIAGLMEGDEPERLLADTKGTLFKLLFHATIPPDPLSSADKTDQPDVIHSGPVTIHRNGIQPSQRVWMELTPEMVTTYPSANESDRVRPIRSALSVQWRRAFDGALYKLAKMKWRSQTGKDSSDEWSYMRCCIPLDRTTLKGISPYHSFATFAGLEVGLDDTRQVDTCNRSAFQQDEYSPPEPPAIQKVKTPPADMLRRSFSLPRTPPAKPEQRPASPLRQNFFDSATSYIADDLQVISKHTHHLDFNIGVLNEQVWFTKALETAVAAAAERRYKADATLPPVVFQISGHDVVATDEDLDRLSRDSSSSEDSPHVEDEETGDTLLQETRKAERASLAAKVFGLKENEGVWINPRFICFWRRNTVAADIRYRFRVEDVKGATAAPSIKVGFVGMALHIHGHRDLRFEFWNKDSRDDMFSPGFFKESLGGFRDWLDNLLIDSWEACRDADVLIESPSTMSGIHIAEALKIPYFRAFTMPWTRTSAYPQAFMVPAFEMGPSFNYSTYVLFDNIIWKATAGQINRWRKKYLGIKSTDMATLSVTKVPFLYNFSSAVVPKPLDWHDDITITGYWNLEDSDTDWSPSPELEDFVSKAKQDGKPLVYISIIKAVEKADVRAIIAKGWSSRGGDPAKEGEDIKLPASCLGVDKIPHSWLFPKAAALIRATTDRVMIEKAARIGEKIRSESGVDQALQAIHHNVIRAGLDRRNLKWAS
ncbi:uncharacterized protein L201_005583 [Kwoniella dendrophila CBS 6074]|uniref:Glycosyltransferase family 28 N-terminal domain-containing protein n=1 Tax=Kwoniella dendrophila CBS 6074 TaxID=1295534 RepID=A0AAX4JZ62_9TREE